MRAAGATTSVVLRIRRYPAGIPERRPELVDSEGADRDHLPPVRRAVAAVPDRPLDGTAVAADGRVEQAMLGQLGPQPPGRGRAAENSLEPPIGEEMFKAVFLCRRR